MSTSTFHTAYTPSVAAPRRTGVRGEVLTAADPGWETARLAWNLTADQRPAAVIRPVDAADVASAVRWAREAGLRVAAQGTGHGACALGSLQDTALLKTDRLRGIQIDTDARTARVEAGVRWGEVAREAGAHGLAGLAGSSATVGVVGYTLGGGLGWLGRKHGLACNSVTAIEVVTADGEALRADHRHEPELFWALRGGGGSFGVVTALEFALYPVAEVFAGSVFWPAEDAAAVLEHYRAWTADLPDEMTSIVRLLQLPPIPTLPEPLRGRQLVSVEACWSGDLAEGARLLAPLRGLGTPVIDTFGPLPASRLDLVHGDPVDPVPGRGRHLLLESVTSDTIAAVLAAAGPAAGTSLVSVELRHLGGALRRARSSHGALAALDASFVMFAVGAVMQPRLRPVIEGDLDRVERALTPWATDATYLNFAERAGAVSRAFTASAYDRLQRVKREYDPTNVLQANHEIPPRE
jgi:FAD/FMN-containing dehydrogenase